MVPLISSKLLLLTGAKHYSKKVNQTYLDLAAEHSLEQMVDFPTRGDNTLNLVFTSHPSYVERCKPLPPIADKMTTFLMFPSTQGWVCLVNVLLGGS
jgi:hypothetical protein